ncbi:nucleoid-associated protein [Roseospira visakhapatnamensis]|uniref:Nucleoid-associated protein n=1 Tax=Roseospira visakhapatnamensis TaxID=390880 RepID=A0A7W6RE75_9PROT|nr:nucleoid-associated protein [Roseospira visakhapatnamensis]MBB4266682.1 nucleoid-associated protein [Roseospira visakhapatnamensis]
MPSETRIHHCAIHALRKEEGGHFVAAPVNAEHDITDTVAWLVDELTSEYAKRSNKAYGVFAVDEDQYPTQRQLRDYMAGAAEDFGGLTARMMATLVDRAKGTAATGGYVIFVHFRQVETEALIVTIVNDKVGARLTGGRLNRTNYLDLGGFRFAGRVDITKWRAGGNRYVDFLKGRGDISEYFQRFLGCDTTVQAAQDTRNVVGVVKRFAVAQGMNQEDRADLLQRAKAIGDRYAMRHEEMTLDAFANELHPTDPAALLEYLTDLELNITGAFVPDRRSLRSLTVYRGKTQLWSLEFERSALDEGEIDYNAEAGTLTIRHIPEGLRDQLRDEVGTDRDQTDGAADL